MAGPALPLTEVSLPPSNIGSPTLTPTPAPPAALHPDRAAKVGNPTQTHDVAPPALLNDLASGTSYEGQNFSSTPLDPPDRSQSHAIPDTRLNAIPPPPPPQATTSTNEARHASIPHRNITPPGFPEKRPTNILTVVPRASIRHPNIAPPIFLEDMASEHSVHVLPPPPPYEEHQENPVIPYEEHQEGPAVPHEERQESPATLGSMYRVLDGAMRPELPTAIPHSLFSAVGYLGQLFRPDSSREPEQPGPRGDVVSEAVALPSHPFGQIETFQASTSSSGAGVHPYPNLRHQQPGRSDPVAPGGQAVFP
ncbi:hypothetical protein FRB99_003036 [Tulasnella sp. 403]|nr:hypothetical protein FRB99_003036 [Tulasnella sp. 403]